MKGLLWIGIALLAVSPLLAQDEEGGVFGGFGPGDESDLPQSGNRGGQPQRQGPNPVDELDAILSKGGQPLSVDQKKTIQTLLDQQIEAMRQSLPQALPQAGSGAEGAPRGPGGFGGGQGAAGGQGQPGQGGQFRQGAAGGQPGQGGQPPQGAQSAPGGTGGSGEQPRSPGGFGGQGQRSQGGFGGQGGQSPPGAPGRPGGQFPPGGAGGFRAQNYEAARQQEEKFIANFLPVLTPEQTTAWKNFEKDQIRARGGYPALKLALEQAGTPATPEQETELQQIFRTYDEQKRELQRTAGPGGQPDAAKRKEADDQYLGALIKALNANQRKALLEWRRISQQPSN